MTTATNERWEVRPAERAGNFDICLPADPGSKGVAVIATVFSGREVAEQIAAAHNTKRGVK